MARSRGRTDEFGYAVYLMKVMKNNLNLPPRSLVAYFCVTHDEWLFAAIFVPSFL